MKQSIEKFILNFVEEYGEKENIWRTPIVKFGDAKIPEIKELRDIVHPEHFMPNDILPDASIIVSYFIPYSEEIGKSNIEGELNSMEWAMAYEITGKLTTKLEEALINYIQEKGYKASAVDEKKAFDKEKLRSRWSQRHIAQYCGLGTFGINNMLITEKGCCGRIGSIVTNLNVLPDSPIKVEYCLKKKSGMCGLCTKRCPVRAFNNIRYEVRLCKEQCDKNRVIYNNINTCGKCVVGLPCTFEKP